MSEWLSREELSELKLYRAGPVVWASLLTWSLIVVGFYLCGRYPSVWSWTLGVLLMGIEQNALSILVHEGAHGLIYPNRKWNDRSASLFYAAPILLQFETYCKRHFQHHWRLATPQDTKRYPRESIRGKRFLRHMLLAMSGVYALRMVLTYVRSSANKRATPRWYDTLYVLLTHGGIIAACWMAGQPWMYPVLWLLPIFTVMTFLVSTRAMIEHQPQNLPEYLSEEEGIPEITRTVLGNALSRFVFAQFNFNYHQEHHLFTQIPFWNLPKLHELLKQRGYFKENPKCLENTYRGVFRRLICGLAPVASPQ